jgi:hypothetical protein
LPYLQIVLRMVGQGGLINPGHRVVVLQKARDSQRVLARFGHARGQYLNPLQNLPSAHGAKGRAEHAQAFHAATHGKTKVA